MYILLHVGSQLIYIFIVSFEYVADNITNKNGSNLIIWNSINFLGPSLGK